MVIGFKIGSGYIPRIKVKPAKAAIVAVVYVLESLTLKSFLGIFSKKILLFIQRIYSEERTVVKIPKPNNTTLNESACERAVCNTPPNNIHSDINPLVGGIPIIVSAPIMVITAVYGIFPARPPSFDILLVPVWRKIEPAIMKRMAFPRPCVT